MGDEVMALLQGPIGSHPRTSWQCIAEKPTGIDFAKAASLPFIFATAYIAIVDIARICQGQSVLIHAAAGDLGQAAVMLTQQYLGGTVYATVSTQQERDILTREYGVPDAHIFPNTEDSLTQVILTATDGRGVDVVLNSLSGAPLQASFDALAQFGHFIELGKLDIERGSLPNMAAFSRSASFTSLDLVAILQQRPDKIQRVLSDIGRLVMQGVIKPIAPISEFSLNEISSAFRHLRAAEQVGKTVLVIEKDQQVRVVPRAPIAKLRADASYLLVGGTGGIGRSLAHWMASHGARNIVVLSRSARQSGKSDAFLAGLREVGCRAVAISCDVADKSDFERVLRACETEHKFPPIRGVVNSAMALKDQNFEQMSLEDWQTSVRPKVAATWNIHSYFSAPGSLDFMVMLASVSGILGTATQANYSAGCSYQDAIARRRQSTGLPAVSLDLGIVREVGYAATAEQRAVMESWRRIGPTIVLGEEDVLSAFAVAIMNQYAQPQTIVGMNTGPGTQ